MTRSLVALLDKDVNCPVTTSIGRLFDGVSALLDVSQVASFEGEAAMALEFLAEREMENIHPQPYRVSLDFQQGSDSRTLGGRLATIDRPTSSKIFQI